ncbi:MAG: ferritin-like domain-containing protein [Candidatus Eremiobacterota bacterium]
MRSVGVFREQLLTLLHVGAELEHALCCQYLFAAFSLKRRVDEGLSWPELEMVREWGASLLKVARQEMEHLGYACNLITALGGTPSFEHQNFPYGRHYWPTHLTFELIPFSVEALRQFVEYERPLGVQDEFSTRPPARYEDVRLEGLAGGDLEFEAVGEVYHHLRGMLADCPYPDRALFIGPQRAQIDNETLGNDRRGYAGVNVQPVRDLKSALAAVDQIIEEGEGSTQACPDGHYQVLIDILRELVSRGPDFAPARPVARNPALRAGVLGEGTIRVTDPFSAGVLELFEGAYELMLIMLYRFVTHQDETDEEMAFLQRMAFFPLMTQIVRPLGELLTELPVGPEHPGLRAGASFERPRISVVSSHREAAWTVMRERFHDLGLRCAELCAQRPDLDRLQLLGSNLKRLAMLSEAPC